MTQREKITVYLSKGPDKERTSIWDRREAIFSGNSYDLSPGYLHTSPLSVVKKLLELRLDLSEDFEVNVERDKKFEGIDKRTYDFITQSCIKLMKAYGG